ncbi:uncharacterized protein LOC115098222 [Rhinatrema bivittatum]|uniref:uncharacterized protein LOC115098222 n=1 Tax=Rhinatrema bivittatum TaxID=194408 RepID=UPI00112B5E02|nr:uncharacterized protein LOC115098222 [Rhinatrema bivittatum]XP_029470530.1 uncharacterized protein LOC115098222 [Rhinatrema bivittatum]
MAPLTAVVSALCVLVSFTFADVPQDVAPKLLEAGSFSAETHDIVHALVRRYTGHRFYDMYHGTSVQAAISIIQTGFIPSKDGMLGRGVYVSRDIKKAQRYPMYLSPTDRVILKVNVRVGKVKKIDRQGHPLQKTWHAHGYDTAWVPPNSGMVPSGLEENCVWDPKRVKVMDVVQAPPAALGNLKSLLHQMKTYHCNWWLVC